MRAEARVVIVSLGSPRAVDVAADLAGAARAAGPVRGDVRAVCAASGVGREPVPGLRLLPLAVPSPQLPAAVAAQAARPGPAGALARLIEENLRSRAAWRAVRRNASVLRILRSADVVVSADRLSDRTVWKLRRRSGAALLSGRRALIHHLASSWPGNESHPGTASVGR